MHAASNPTAGDEPVDPAVERAMINHNKRLDAANVCVKCRQQTALASGNLCETCGNPSGRGDSGAALTIDFVVADNAEKPAVLLVDENGNTFATMALTDENQERAALIVQAVNSFDGLLITIRTAIANIDHGKDAKAELVAALDAADPQP